jgi:general secretion pathway protein G
MYRRIYEARKNEGGFTLIELLIVIVILGVLAGIVVFAVSGITDKGDTSACKADKKTVEVASEAYYARNGAYAANIAALVTAGLLRDAPSSSHYTIGYDATTGAVTCSLE